MKTTQRVTVAAVATLLAAFAGPSGCERQPAGWGVHSADIHRTGTANDARLFVRFGEFGADSSAVAFWSSEPWKSFEASWKRESGAVAYRGTLVAGGREFTAECLTADGQGGSVAIGPERFRLEDGPLFLVRSANGGAEHGGLAVLQLKRPLADLPRDPEALAALLGSDPEVGGFFRKGAPKP